MSEFFDTSPPDPIERLARFEGACNFGMGYGGSEAGPDTTEDAAALAFAKARGASPEILECYVAQSDRWHLPICTMVFRAIRDLSPKMKERDYPWVQGAVLDAFLLFRYGQAKGHFFRAKQLGVDHDAYLQLRKLAYGTMLSHFVQSERKWVRARFHEL